MKKLQNSFLNPNSSLFSNHHIYQRGGILILINNVEDIPFLLSVKNLFSITSESSEHVQLLATNEREVKQKYDQYEHILLDS